MSGGREAWPTGLRAGRPCPRARTLAGARCRRRSCARNVHDATVRMTWDRRVRAPLLKPRDRPRGTSSSCRSRTHGTVRLGCCAGVCQGNPRSRRELQPPMSLVSALLGLGASVGTTPTTPTPSSGRARGGSGGNRQIGQSGQLLLIEQLEGRSSDPGHDTHLLETAQDATGHLGARADQARQVPRVRTGSSPKNSSR